MQDDSDIIKPEDYAKSQAPAAQPAPKKGLPSMGLGLNLASVKRTTDDEEMKAPENT